MTTTGDRIRVGVFGAGGRMGATVCQAVSDDPDLDLVAVVDQQYSGLDLRTVTGVDSELRMAPSPAAFERAGVDVVVDFSQRSASMENLCWLGAHGIHAVVGTTGFSDSDLDTLRGCFVESNCIVAPNFAIGAVLMIHFAELAAPYFDSAEIIELHHDQKVDAPSGTAMHTARRMAAASSEWTPDPTTSDVVKGARGAEGPGGIRIHSVRMRGLVAHQEVLLGAAGQTLSLRHDSYDRTSFMPGVVLAVKHIGERPGLTVGLGSLLGLGG